MSSGKYRSFYLGFDWLTVDKHNKPDRMPVGIGATHTQKPVEVFPKYIIRPQYIVY